VHCVKMANALDLSSKRSFLQVASTEDLKCSGPSLRVCTYNVLAQVLVNRSVFPRCAGDSLKWKPRSKRLLADIVTYAPDVLALQEVDQAQWVPFWQPQLKALGMQSACCAESVMGHCICDCNMAILLSTSCTISELSHVSLTPCCSVVLDTSPYPHRL